MKNKMRPIHPGEILRGEYLVPPGLSARPSPCGVGWRYGRARKAMREGATLSHEQARA
jgi:plasmid maintenance system antidote protein VapI